MVCTSRMTAGAGMTGRIFKGLGLVLGGKAGAGLISLVYLIIAARALGPHDYGILMLVHGYVTAVCGIVEFPAGLAIIRYGAQAMEEDAAFSGSGRWWNWAQAWWPSSRRWRSLRL
jgi:hypothetical protein